MSLTEISPGIRKIACLQKDPLSPEPPVSPKPVYSEEDKSLIALFMCSAWAGARANDSWSETKSEQTVFLRAVKMLEAYKLGTSNKA